MRQLGGYSWRRLWLLAFCLMFSLLPGWFFATEQRSIPPTYLQKIKAACAQDMVRSTCIAMSGGMPKAEAGTGSLVFIAGVGAVDAGSYKKLYEAGEEMCAVVTEECETDWNSPQCKIARRIYIGHI